jgi:hypothetical protein
MLLSEKLAHIAGVVFHESPHFYEGTALAELAVASSARSATANDSAVFRFVE